LPAACPVGYCPAMNDPSQVTADADAQARRVELARRAFKEFYAQCFWSSDPNLVVREEHIPLIMRNLRLHGGHRGYRIVAELCR
jgi:hypothetical protein